MADQGFQFGFDQAAKQEASRNAYDMLQRQFLASQYDNLINQPLPDQTKDPEGYKAALDAKAKAMEQRQKVYSPEHHANLVDAIHGLITGKQEGAQPQTPPQPAGAPGGPPGSAAPPPGVHPFVDNPVLAKGDEFIKALGQHLKAFAHPIAPQPGTDWKSLAAAPSPEQVKAQEEADKLALQHKYKMEELGAKPKPRDTVQKAEWDSEARKLGYTGYDDPKMTADDAEKISRSLKEATTLPTWKSVVDGDTIYAVDAHDPTKKTAIGKKSEVTTTYYDTIQQQANGDLVRVPMVRYTKKGSGETIAELPAADAPPIPVSTQSPQVPSAGAKNPGARPPGTKPSGGAVKRQPVSAKSPQLPNGSQAVGHRPTPAERESQTQAAKDIPILDAAESQINDYVNNGVFDGPGDLALQHAFFTATQPSTGFRMTKVQQDMLMNSRSWLQGIKAKAYHAATGRWYTDEQVKQIADAALSAIADKKKALQRSLGPQSSQSPQVLSSSFDPNAYPVAH
jgi:hypothetical protein